MNKHKPCCRVRHRKNAKTRRHEDAKKNSREANSAFVHSFASSLIFRDFVFSGRDFQTRQLTQCRSASAPSTRWPIVWADGRSTIGRKGRFWEDRLILGSGSGDGLRSRYAGMAATLSPCLCRVQPRLPPPPRLWNVLGDRSAVNGVSKIFVLTNFVMYSSPLTADRSPIRSASGVAGASVEPRSLRRLWMRRSRAERLRVFALNLLRYPPVALSQPDAAFPRI